jgi:hypothetical protein
MTNKSETMKLLPITRKEIFEQVYRNAKPNSLLAFGRMANGQDKAYPRPLIMSGPKDAAILVDNLQAKGINPSHLKWNLYGPDLLPESKERADVGKAIRDRAERLIQGGKAGYLKTHTYCLAELAILNIDLDVGREKDCERCVTAKDALETVKAMVEEGLLPPPSLIGHSGRGLYILYVLTDGQGGLPPATKGNKDAFKKAADRIIEVCRGAPCNLNPDPNSKSLVQFFKTPDSRHPKTGERISYHRWLIDENDQCLRRFTLDVLCSVEHPNDVKPSGDLSNDDQSNDVHPNNVQSPVKGSGEAGIVKRPYKKTAKARPDLPFYCRWEELCKLARHRGGIKQGDKKRTMWTSIVYNTARDALIRTKGNGGYDHARAAHEALDWTIGFSDKYFLPPMPETEIRSIAKRNRRNYKNSTLAGILKVTDGEAKAIGLKFIVPESVKKAMKADRKANSKTAQKGKRNAEIARDGQAGMTSGELASKYGLAARQIKRILASSRPA